MGKARVWLITPSVLIGLVAVAGLGRYGLGAATTRVGSTSAAVHVAAANDVSCFDTSAAQNDLHHGRARRPTGGAGLGRRRARPWCCSRAQGTTPTFTMNSHTSSQIGSASSASRAGAWDARANPLAGMTSTRERATISRCSTNSNIRQAVFVGHSIAGTEMSKLAAAYPDRVKKLVYLDALDIGSGGWAKIPQPPGSPELSATDLESVQRLAAAFARDDGYRKPLAAICNMIRMDASGRILGPITPSDISGKLAGGLQPAAYVRIQAPALGIFNRVSTRFRMPYYWALNSASKRSSTAASTRYRSGTTARSSASAPR